ncbi:MAG TPA: hypothetical protein DDX85_10330 [Nitrospiraceae bacterium]|nr:hypothetical protein [Nitrospiraceae bacterium]
MNLQETKEKYLQESSVVHYYHAYYDIGSLKFINNYLVLFIAHEAICCIYIEDDYITNNVQVCFICSKYLHGTTQ